MNLYIDIRCLQDERFASRGVGYHTAVLLSKARNYLPPDIKLVGLTTPSVGKLENRFAEVFDSIETVFVHPSPASPAAFIEMSPLTHDPVMPARLLGRSNIFTATVVYDFIPFDMPERYLSDAGVAAEYTLQIAWLQSFNHYFAISQFTAKRLQEICEIEASEITTTGVALRPEFERTMLSSKVPVPLDCESENLRLPSKYVLCVAGADRRKNVEVLFAAHARLPPACCDYHLVIVGKYTDNHRDKLVDRYADFGGRASKLHFVQDVSDAALVKIYRGASCAICSSEMEGFSLPVIEAIACKCPILVSNIDAHRELVTEPEAIFAADDSEQLGKLLTNILLIPGNRESLIESQLPVADRFISEKVCRSFWLPIARGIREVRRQSGKISRQRLTQRPRIAILSPFPPEASGVADYTRRTVQSLGRIADVDVYTSAENPTPTPEVMNFFPLSDVPYTSGQYDNVLAVVGNSHLHTRIIELQRMYGGPCLIHDNRLAEVYNWWKGPDYLADLASRHLGRKVTCKEVEGWITTPGNLPSMFFGELIESAKPLVVHSRGIQARCLEEHGSEPDYLPFCCYRDFSPSDLTQVGKRIARSDLGIDLEEFVIVSLGLVGLTKGTYECIEAVAKLKASGIDAQFYFVGNAGKLYARLVAHAKQLGIENHIHLFEDWVSEEDYNRFVLAADMAIQLRNHFFGGLSGAMLDCIASGLTTITNEDLAKALDAPESVHRISDKLSVDELALAIQRIYKEQSYLERLRPSREKYVSDHSFDQYAIQLLHVLGLPYDSKRRLNVPVVEESHLSTLELAKP
jgi:glycosyltransferase involved in cell wall biosynthesis